LDLKQHKDAGVMMSRPGSVGGSNFLDQLINPNEQNISLSSHYNHDPNNMYN